MDNRLSTTSTGTSDKRNVPVLPGQIVDRPDVLAHLDGVLTRPLTTLTAPAGYGKTIAAAQWCRRQELPVVWADLSGAGDDAERQREWVVGTVCDALGIEPTAMYRALADGDPFSLLAGAPATIFVFDGIPAWLVENVIELAYFLDCAHDCDLHALAISRCPPPSELTPLQMSGVVAHLTAAELELDASEVAAVVEAYSGDPIDDTTAEDLADRLDGWMAGAVICGVSRPAGGGATADGLLDAAWDGIEGYVTTETIKPVPADVRSFLLRTSCVDELSAELCDRLTDRTDSGTMLRLLRMSGLPIVRNAAANRTYRYQHQFRAVLDAQFQQEDSLARAAALRFAAKWYNEHQQPFEAAECLLRLGEWEELVGTIFLHLQSIFENDETERLARLVVRAPPHLMREHLELVTAGAWVLLWDGRLSAAKELLSVYRPLMTPEKLMIADNIRALTFGWIEDMSVPFAAAESAIAAADEVGEDQSYTDSYNPSTTDFYRVGAQTSAVVASSFAGWWQRGRSYFVDIRPETTAAAPQVHVIRTHGGRATYLVLAGEVSAGLDEARFALRAASEAGMTDNRTTAEAHFALGEGLRLSGEFDQVAKPLDMALELANVNGRRNLIAAVTASQAHLLVDVGEPERALELLDRYRTEIRHHAPHTLAGLLYAARARALAATDDYFAALHKLGEGPSTSATATVEVAVALTLRELDRARAALRRWPDESTAASTVRRSLAAALIHSAAGETRKCTGSLRSGLVVAAAHGLVQPVAEWGALMGRLLRQVDRKSRNGGVGDVVSRAETLIAAGGKVAPRLTVQESVVLGHLGQGLSVPAIAREMVLSVNTVKTHVKAIYRKLGAKSRAEALTTWRSTLPSRDRV